MAWEMGNGRLIEACPRVDVNSVDDLVRGFRRVWCRQMRRLVLAGGREQQASIGGERQSPEERGEGFVRVNVGILDA